MFRKLLINKTLLVLNACSLAASLILFLTSFLNVRTLTFGWYSTTGAMTGMCSSMVELGNGGILFLASDIGYVDSNHTSVDGLDLVHSKLSPILDIEKDEDRPQYPRLIANHHWIRDRIELCGFGIAFADDWTTHSTSRARYRGIQFKLPLSPIILISAINTVALYSKTKGKSLRPGFNITAGLY